MGEGQDQRESFARGGYSFCEKEKKEDTRHEILKKIQNVEGPSKKEQQKERQQSKSDDENKQKKKRTEVMRVL